MAQPLTELQNKRNRLLARLIPLAEQPASANAERVAQPLQEFCRELINYLAAGHYYILQNVRGSWSQRAAIAQTTESAMHFAEQHERGSNDFEQGTRVLGASLSSWRQTRSQLGTLALALTDRFDTEDRLLGNLQRHT